MTEERVKFVANETERSFSIQEGKRHTELCVLVAAGDDPAHLSVASYEEGNDEPTQKVKLYRKHIELAEELLRDQQSRKIIGI